MQARLADALRRLATSPVPVFVAVSLYLLAVHEPWRDEAQPWLIARDAPSLFGEMDSEGSPALWYLLMLPLVKLDLPFLSLRLLHVALATAALSILVLRSPFPRHVHWLFAFGYFALYEYNVIARSYVLTLLLLFAIAALHRDRLSKPLAYGALVLLLANANSASTVIALVLGGAFALDVLRERRRVPAALAGALLPALGVALAALQVLPKPDLATWRTDANLEWGVEHLRAALLGAAQAFLPLTDFAQWKWGDTVFATSASPQPVLVVGLALYAGSFLFLRGAPRATILYGIASLGLLGVYYAKHQISGEIRHHGLLFALFVFALWLAREERAQAAPEGGAASAARKGSLAAVSLAILLSAHVVASPAAIVHDGKEDFSAAQRVAAYLEENGFADNRTFLAVHPSFLAAGILVHLEETPTMFFLQTEEHGSYVRWTQKYHDTSRERFSYRTVLERLDNATAGGDYDRVLLISWSPSYGSDGSMTRLAVFPAMVEPLVVYEVHCEPRCYKGPA